MHAHERQAAETRRIDGELPPQLVALGARRRRHHVGAAPVELGRQADEELDARGTGDLVPQIGPERLAGDAPNHFAEQESLRVHVVAVTRAGRPPRRLGGERVRHDLPAQHGARRQRARDGRKPGLMRQQEADRHLCLAGLREFGPVAGDRSVEIERAGVDEAERADGGDGFPDGVEVDDRVALPRSRPRGVGVAGPHVDHRVRVHVDGQRGADLGARCEDVREGAAQRLERGLAVSVNDRRRGGHQTGV